MSPAVNQATSLPSKVRGTLLFSAVLLFYSGIASAEQVDAEPEQARFERGVVIRFEGMITPLLEQFVYRKLDEAKRDGADLIILEIESPGGIVEPSFKIARAIREVDWATTVAFIPVEALSGAAVVALGCDQIYMHPDASLGNVGVITLGEDFLFRYAEEKFRTGLASQMRDLAEATGRPPALTEAMIDMDLVVYQVTNRATGEQTFMSGDEIESSDDPEVWQKGKPILESREKHFLQVNGRRAVELRLAEGNARDLAELTGTLGLAGKPRVLRPNAVDTAVYILNNPLVTGLLFVIGLVALYIEFSAPGISIGGLISLLCFALFFWSRFLGGTAEVLEVVLFLTGVLFLAVEVFVLPGFGVAGVTGMLLIASGLVLASQDFIIPQTSRQVESLSVSMLVLASSGVAFLIAASVLSRYFGALPVFHRLVLKPAPAGQSLDGATRTSDGKPLPGAPSVVGVGDWGVAMTPLRPAGKARFGDEMLDVLTDGSFVDAGRAVRIDDVRGSRILVSQVEEA